MPLVRLHVVHCAACAHIMENLAGQGVTLAPLRLFPDASAKRDKTVRLYDCSEPPARLANEPNCRDHLASTEMCQNASDSNEATFFVEPRGDCVATERLLGCSDRVGTWRSKSAQILEDGET